MNSDLKILSFSMSKATSKDRVDLTELKALCLIGPEVVYNPEISKLYNQDNCLIVGNGIDSIEILNIANELKKHKVRIGPKTRIDILAHGINIEKEHIITVSDKNIPTKDFLLQLQDLSPNNPIYVQLWSCYSGTANKDIEALNPGSIIVTHIKSRYKELTEVQEYARLHSITRYMNESDLSPHLQYLYDQLENYQATTFNQKESDGRIIKFKTIRNPAYNSIANKISYILQKNISEERLVEELQNYLGFEGKRFYELFGDYLFIEETGKFQDHISNITNENMRDFITGTLINLVESISNDETKSKDRIIITANKIINNLNPELINHSTGGIIPLLIAIDNNNLEMVQILLKKGANPNFLDPIDGCTTLHNACELNFIKIANLLLEYGGDPNYPNKVNSTPLMEACTNRSLDMVKILVEKGAKTNSINKDNLTPLIIACSSKSERITKILLDHGANPNLKIPGGSVPLIIACSNNSERIVLNLLEKNADPNVVDSNGTTPLFAVCKGGNLKLVKLLVEKGADLELENRGQSALSIAEKYRHIEVVEFLEEKMNRNKNLINLDDPDKLFYFGPPPKLPRPDKNNKLENKKLWVQSVSANSSSNQPQHDFFQSNPGAKSKISKEITNAAIEELNKVNPINNETRTEIKNVLSEDLQKIPVNILVENKQGVINVLTEELKLNNQENNNNREYRTSEQNLREIGNKIVIRYGYREQIQPPNTTVSTNKWQQHLNNNSHKDNYKGRG